MRTAVVMLVAGIAVLLSTALTTKGESATCPANLANGIMARAGRAS